jgi:hypothetical protein
MSGKQGLDLLGQPNVESLARAVGTITNTAMSPAVFTNGQCRLLAIWNGPSTNAKANYFLRPASRFGFTKNHARGHRRTPPVKPRSGHGERTYLR